MNPTLDDSHYAYADSWWNPRFLEPGIDKTFRLQFNSSALISGRIGLGILIFFWCGFVWFDQFLSPSSKSAVLLFRFAVITPLLLLFAFYSLFSVPHSLVFALSPLCLLSLLYKPFSFPPGNSETNKRIAAMPIFN